ncbi:MAG: hypothetical protein ACK4MQ_00185 [Hyphomonas sp.]
MAYPDRFPYVRTPPEGWRRAVIKAAKADLPRIPAVSLQRVVPLILGSILWLIYAGLVTGLVVAVFWVGVAGVRVIETASEFVWPAFAALPVVIIAAGLMLRALLWLRAHLLPGAPLVAGDTPCPEPEPMRRT